MLVGDAPDTFVAFDADTCPDDGLSSRSIHDVPAYLTCYLGECDRT